MIYDDELVDIDKKTLEQIKYNSCNDAPWVDLLSIAKNFNFLEHGINAGLKWKSHSDVLTAYINPKTKSGIKDQERARKNIEWSPNLNAYPSGILLFDENKSGQWEDGNLSPVQDLVGKDNLMAKLMEVFWPNIPPVIYNKLTDILVEREFYDKSDYLDGKIQVVQDCLDFKKAFKVLSYANKLIPHPVIDWEKIANAPSKVKAPKVKV